MGDNRWRQEREWPLARTSWTNYYLHAGGVLGTAAPGQEGVCEAGNVKYKPGKTTIGNSGNSELHGTDTRELAPQQSSKEQSE